MQGGRHHRLLALTSTEASSHSTSQPSTHSSPTWAASTTTNILTVAANTYAFSVSRATTRAGVAFARHIITSCNPSWW